MIKIEEFMEYSQTIKERLNIKTSPVGVKIYTKEENAKKQLPKIQDNIMHCQAIINASKGASFYATKEELGCPNGVADLGLTSFPEGFIEGELFENINVTSTLSSGKHCVDQVPKMPYKTEAIGYAPLEDAKFIPDVIIIIAKPREIFDLIRANTYLLGERITSSVGGTQSFCGDIVINTFLTKKPNISFGCMGSHIATDFKESEVIIGFPAETFDNIVESVKITNPQK